MTPELTSDEMRAIASLKRLAKKWPRTLLFWAGGCGAVSLRIMKGHPAESPGGAEAVTVASIDVPNDGGVKL